MSSRFPQLSGVAIYPFRIHPPLHGAMVSAVSYLPLLSPPFPPSCSVEPSACTRHVTRAQGGYSHQKYTFYPGRTSNNIHPWQRLWLQQLQDTPRHSGSGHILSTVNLLIDMFSYVLLSNIFTQWIYISIARTRIMRPSLWHDSNLDTHCSSGH